MTASQRISAAEYLLARMKAGGIDYVLANSGTDFPPLVEAYARAAETGIAYPEALPIAHEGVAMGMAHGHYLVTGRPLAVMVHVNVGLANGSMGVINAASGHAPVLICSGRTPITESGRFGARSIPIHWGQEMRDQGGIVRESVKWDFELRYPEQAGLIIDRALAIAQSDPPGPVYLSLPREALGDQCERPDLTAPSRFATVRAGAPAQASIAAAAAILAKAKNPVLIAQSALDGDDGFAALANFVDRFAIPVVEFWSTRNAVSTEHPMHAGREPGPWLAEADAVIVLDALVPWVPSQVQLQPGCKVIGLGADPLFQRQPIRGFPVDVALAGDAAVAIAALTQVLADQEAAMRASVAQRRAAIAARRAAEQQILATTAAEGSGTPMSPAWVSHCLAQAKDENAAIFSELGVDGSYLRVTKPRSLFFHPLSAGLGWALPAALGAQLADRDRQVIACVGDGSYMFANPVACHQTALAHGLPILTVIFNNGVWNAVRRATLAMYPQGRAAELNVMPMTSLDPAPDYAAVARAHGAHAERIGDGAALPAALERAFHVMRSERRQALLELRVSL